MNSHVLQNASEHACDAVFRDEVLPVRIVFESFVAAFRPHRTQIPKLGSRYDDLGRHERV